MISTDIVSDDISNISTIGIIGFGKLGQFLFRELQKCSDIQIGFVWNRSKTPMEGLVPEALILENIYDFKFKMCQLIIEVCHPDVVKSVGKYILQYSDLMIGSPTCLSDDKFKSDLLNGITDKRHKIWIPSGAMWGVEDIRRLDKSGSIKSLKITMEKHPDSLKVSTEEYRKICEKSKLNNCEEIIFEGTVNQISKIAPNNVNTMAVAALACSSLGFEMVKGCLKSNPNNKTHHRITVELETEGGLHVTTYRDNPATVGNVTGLATFYSFLASVREILSATSNQSQSIMFC